MSSDKTNNTSSSNTKIPNDIEASFETSFADDVNGAAFKSLLKNNSSNNNTNNSNSAMTPTDQQQVHLDPLQLDINSGDRTDEGDKQPSEDLNLFISDLLEQMQSKFENMGNTILGRIDDMGSRIDTLEKSIGDLMDQAGLSESSHGPSGDIVKSDKSNDS